MHPRRLRDDGGAATAELVIAAPLLLVMIMLVVQFALYMHATSVASTAAQEGVRVATLQGGSITEGEQEAAGILDSLASSLLPNPQVSGQYVDGGEAVRMTVQADVLEVYAFPGLDLGLSVTETAERPVEEFRPVTEAPPRDS